MQTAARQLKTSRPRNEAVSSHKTKRCCTALLQQGHVLQHRGFKKQLNSFMGEKSIEDYKIVEHDL